ncbi:MAG: anion permease [Candidatus Cloacimonetes bacterium]|nr:anion permease [Candidatus Cloacimonadota bacterium]
MSFLLLSSGFFLGWSLGANDGGNIFGPAVTTRMLKFKTAAIIASVFIILGSVFQGSGAVQTLSSLGSVNQLFGSFTVAVAAALTLFLMVRVKLPVSSSQSVVGAIIGWNLFSGAFTDFGVMAKIITTWILTPVLSAFLAMGIYYLVKRFITKREISLFKFDFYTRIGFIALVAFSAYSLGANNIANVVGMFVDSAPFTPVAIFNRFILSSQMQLFFLGGASIAVGILTKSMSNAQTVGNAIFKMSPITGFIAILASSLVLFLFSSRGLQILLVKIHFPTLPLVPVSSSQAIVGAIIGIGIIKGSRNIQYKNLSKIALGWFVNPVIACIICFISLFFVQNVFDQRVYQPTVFIFDQKVMSKLEEINIETRGLSALEGKTFYNARSLRSELNQHNHLTLRDKTFISQKAELFPMYVSANSLVTIRIRNHFSDTVYLPLLELEHENFAHKWELVDRLSNISEVWRFKPKKVANDFYNSELEKRYELLYMMFKDGE